MILDKQVKPEQIFLAMNQKKSLDHFLKIQLDKTHKKILDADRNNLLNRQQ
jgi:hypothetical protein